jgi:hypothetical protein
MGASFCNEMRRLNRRAAAVAIMVVGNHHWCDAGWEKCPLAGEGKEAPDRKSITLEQEELIKQVFAANPEGTPRGSWHDHVPQRKWALVHLELAQFPAEARHPSEALVAIGRVLLSVQPSTRCLRKNSSVRWRARLAACGA